MVGADTVYGHRDTQTRLASDTADNLIWERYTHASGASSPSVAAALSRINFNTKSSPRPLHTVIEMANSEVTLHAPSGKALVVVVGRSRRMAVESHQAELRGLISERKYTIGSEVSKTLGDVGAAVVAAGTNASLLVMQSFVT